eukprot:8246118-Pyramimonas_sp.AAC.1
MSYRSIHTSGRVILMSYRAIHTSGRVIIMSYRAIHTSGRAVLSQAAWDTGCFGQWSTLPETWETVTIW